MNVYKTIAKMPNFKSELMFLPSILLFEPRREKTCLWGFRPGKTNRHDRHNISNVKYLHSTNDMIIYHQRSSRTKTLYVQEQFLSL